MTQEENIVECGRCRNCRAKKTAQWAFRLIQEDRRSILSYFVTLTYATEHLPISALGYNTLDKKEIPAFVKRCRAFTTRTNQQLQKIKNGENVKRPKIGADWVDTLPPIKYYGVGEYGHKFKRPHYHLIMFNVNADAILNAWTKGEVYLGNVQGASVGYVLKYIQKRTYEGIFEGDDRQPIFSLSSKNLGTNYITDNIRNYHASSNNYHLVLEGQIIPMSKYYRDKIYKPHQLDEIKNEIAIKKAESTQLLTPAQYFDKCYEQWQFSLSNQQKCKKQTPADHHLFNTGTTIRKKIQAIKRSTRQVKRYPIRVSLSRSYWHVTNEDCLLPVNNQYSTCHMTHQKARRMTYPSIATLTLSNVKN